MFVDIRSRRAKRAKDQNRRTSRVSDIVEDCSCPSRGGGHPPAFVATTISIDFPILSNWKAKPCLFDLVFDHICSLGQDKKCLLNKMLGRRFLASALSRCKPEWKGVAMQDWMSTVKGGQSVDHHNQTLGSTTHAVTSPGQPL